MKRDAWPVRWGDYRDAAVIFIEGVYLVIKLHLTAVKVVVSLAVFALVMSGCSNGEAGPGTVAWIIVLVLFLMALGIFALIRPRK